MIDMKDASLKDTLRLDEISSIECTVASYIQSKSSRLATFKEKIWSCANQNSWRLFVQIYHPSICQPSLATELALLERICYQITLSDRNLRLPLRYLMFNEDFPRILCFEFANETRIPEFTCHS
jgi:hypothetical protein